MNFLRKLHVIATWIALIAIFITMLLLFLYCVDRIFRWDIIPQSWEIFLTFFAWLMGIWALGATIMSLLLSFYRRIEE